jgi:hypothetical protein
MFVQSYYEVAEMAIFATSPKELKKRVDRKLATLLKRLHESKLPSGSLVRG